MQVNVEQELWYYDLLPRTDADRMVKQDGDYLVRFSDTKGYVLTTKWEGQARHFVIQKLEDEVIFYFIFVCHQLFLIFILEWLWVPF